MTKFQRLSLTHALQTAGDASMLVALADSLFLSLTPGEGRTKVLLYLLITVLPLAVAAPMIGPVIDRAAGGRKFIVIATTIARLLVMILMMGSLDGWGLYPLAFLAQVLQKTYSVSRAALVPSVVASEEELVEANAKLGVIGGVAGFIGVIPALIVSAIAGGKGALVVGALLYLAATLSGFRLSGDVIAPAPAQASERAELRSTRIVLAATAMSLLRAAVGFLILLLMFSLTENNADKAKFGLAMSIGAIGTLLGNVAGPRLRRLAREELLLTGALILSALMGVFAGVMGGLGAGIVLAAVVNFSSAIGRLAFDSILQQSAPDANRGRAFAQFEVKFGVAFAVAAVLPVIISIPTEIGFVLIGAACAFAVGTYLVSMRRLKLGRPLPEPIGRRLVRSARRLLRRRTFGEQADRATLPPPDPRSRR